MTALEQGEALFNAWKSARLALDTLQRSNVTDYRVDHADRAEQTAWDTLIDTVEADHQPDTCPCRACQVWRADSPADLLK